MHLYHDTNARLLLDTTTSGTGSIEFRRGTGFDIQNDYRFINDTDSFIKLQYENNQQDYGDATAQLAWFTPTYSIIHKNTQMNGRVGIGTTFHATRSLEVLGDANISGTLSSGVANITGLISSGGLSVSGSANISSSTANTTSLTIQNNFTGGTLTTTPSATTTGTTGIYTYQVFTYNKPQIELTTGVSGWRLVRFLPPTATGWHPINDDLVGTTTYGTAYSTTTAWSIPFGTFDEFVFGTLNLQYWMQITKTQAVGANYGGIAKTIIKSSFSATSYSAIQYNRGAGNDEDPWMSIQNHPTQIVYGENSYMVKTRQELIINLYQ